MKIRARLLAAGLAISLLFSVSAAAAQTEPSPRKEDLDVLYSTLQKVHPNLYNTHTAAEFEAHIAEIEGRMDTESDLNFALDLQSVAAMAEDSHTSLDYMSGFAGKLILYPFAINWMEDRWVLTSAGSAQSALLGQTLVAVNGLTMDQVLDRFSVIFSADNEVALRKQLSGYIAGAEILEYLDIAQADETLSLTVRDSAGKETSFHLDPITQEQLQSLGDDAFASLSAQRTAAPATAFQQKYYFSLPLDDSTYYIQYNTCREDPNLPMEDFAAQVATDLEGGAYTQLLIDLRNNGGGSDGVLVPILCMLPGLIQDGTRVYGLIGERTFSSALINAVEIQEAGGLLAGEAAAGSVNHFGEVTAFQLPNSGYAVYHSNQYFDLSTLLEGRQIYTPRTALAPDVAVSQTVSDYLHGKDTLVDTLLQKGDTFTAPTLLDSSLTRGRLAGLLYATAQQHGAPAESIFSDVFPFAWYNDAVNWCAQAGVVTGEPDGIFSPARLVTVQEAALMITRFVSCQGIQPEVKYTEAPPQWAKTPEEWSLDAVNTLWSWGWLDDGFHPGGYLTRAQGEALAAHLAQLDRE